VRLPAACVRGCSPLAAPDGSDVVGKCGTRRGDPGTRPVVAREAAVDDHIIAAGGDDARLGARGADDSACVPDSRQSPNGRADDHSPPVVPTCALMYRGSTRPKRLSEQAHCRAGDGRAPVAPVARSTFAPPFGRRVGAAAFTAVTERVSGRDHRTRMRHDGCIRTEYCLPSVSTEEAHASTRTV